MTGHHPNVVGGGRHFGWDCPCGRQSSKDWPTQFEAAYAAVVHVRNPDGPC